MRFRGDGETEITAPVFGAAARYADAHIYVALDLIYRGGRAGRQSLADELGIGEGSVRSMLNVLREWRWIQVRQSGVTLTELGKESFRGFGMQLVRVSESKYSVGNFQYGIIVRGAAASVTDGMKQRDLAVMNGAEGASVFVMIKGELIFPKNWNLDEQDPETAARLRQTGMRDGDVLIIAGADTEKKARLAAAAAGLAMKRFRIIVSDASRFF